jgi:hypothetical protein
MPLRAKEPLLKREITDAVISGNSKEKSSTENVKIVDGEQVNFEIKAFKNFVRRRTGFP